MAHESATKTVKSASFLLNRRRAGLECNPKSTMRKFFYSDMLLTGGPSADATQRSVLSSRLLLSCEEDVGRSEKLERQRSSRVKPNTYDFEVSEPVHLSVNFRHTAFKAGRVLADHFNFIKSDTEPANLVQQMLPNALCRCELSVFEIEQWVSDDEIKSRGHL